MAGKAVAERIDFDVDRLSNAHGGELRLLEVRGHPDIERHQHHDGLRRGSEGADGGGQLGDPAIDGRAQLGTAEIRIGLSFLRFGLIDLGGCDATLRGERRDLLLGGGLRRLSRIERRLLALQVGAGLLRALHGARTLVHEVLVPRIFVTRKIERRLRLDDLFGRLHDLRLLRLDLRLDIGETASRLLDLSLSLRNGGGIVTVVDLGQQVAGFDNLVVRHEDADDRSRNLRAD